MQSQFESRENDRRSGTLLQGGDSALCKESKMVTYLVSYDLHKLSQNTSELTGALRSKGARRILNSLWSLTTPSSAEQVRSWVMQFLSEKIEDCLCCRRICQL